MLDDRIHAKDLFSRVFGAFASNILCMLGHPVIAVFNGKQAVLTACAALSRGKAHVG